MTTAQAAATIEPAADLAKFQSSTAVVEGLKAQDVLMHTLKTGNMDKLVNYLLNHQTSDDLSTSVPGATVAATGQKGAKYLVAAASSAALVAATLF